MGEISKIQLSPNRIIEGYTTVWNQPGPEVDIVMELGKLSFREGSVDEIFSIHVVEHLFDNEIPDAVSNWNKCLKKNGSLYVIANDFEYICRAFIGGDVSIEDINKDFSTPSQITREYLVALLGRAGIPTIEQTVWFESIPKKYKKEEAELIISTKKHG